MRLVLHFAKRYCLLFTIFASLTLPILYISNNSPNINVDINVLEKKGIAKSIVDDAQTTFELMEVKLAKAKKNNR